MLLRRAREGDRAAEDSLLSRVYPELRRIAQSMICDLNRMPAPTDGTGLVNDACCRLLEREKLAAEDRQHFFFLLGRAMHDELTEQARAELAQKRGGGRRRLAIDMAGVTDQRSERRTMEIRDAIERFRLVDPEGARVAELRFLNGLSLEATARALDTTVAVVRRQWAYAKAWLGDYLGGGGDRATDSKS